MAVLLDFKSPGVPVVAFNGLDKLRSRFVCQEFDSGLTTKAKVTLTCPTLNTTIRHESKVG